MNSSIHSVFYLSNRAGQAKERYYRGEIKRVMQEAELAGLLVSK